MNIGKPPQCIPNNLVPSSILLQTSKSNGSNKGSKMSRKSQESRARGHKIVMNKNVGKSIRQMNCRSHEDKSEKGRLNGNLIQAM